MAGKADQIQFGGKVRRLRRARKMSQKELAVLLGVSPSYVNLIEHNRRNLTVQILLKLAGIFNIDVADIQENNDARLAGDLMEVYSDDTFLDSDITNQDVKDIVASNPTVARTIVQLYDQILKMRQSGGHLVEATVSQINADEPISHRSLLEPVSDFIQERANYFASLELAADRVRMEMDFDQYGPDRAMESWLYNVFGVEVVEDYSVAGDDSHLSLSLPDDDILRFRTGITPSTRRFSVARHLGLRVASIEIDALVSRGQFGHPKIDALARSALSSYFAAALLMPYEAFLDDAQLHRYDIDFLAHKYGTSFEQVCHRFTNLQKPGAQGVPFHLIRTDIAGNISKRFSLSGIHIPRHTGACPKWNVYTAFLNSGRISAQLSQMPDQTTFCCIARSVTKGEARYGAPQRHFSIGLGCDIIHARKIVYFDGLDLNDSGNIARIGPGCRLCPRINCFERVEPSSVDGLR